MQDKHLIVVVAITLTLIVIINELTKKDERDGARISWVNIGAACLLSIILFVRAFVNYKLGACDEKSWLDFSVPFFKSQSSICNLDVIIAYGIFAISLALTLWNGFVLGYRALQTRKRSNARKAHS